MIVLQVCYSYYVMNTTSSSEKLKKKDLIVIKFR